MQDDKLLQIEAQREQQSVTRRPTVEKMEALIYQPFAVLDHGFIRVLDYMGDDSAVVQAARVSYGRGIKRKQDDEGLISFLMRNGHTSPFEMCEIKFHIKLPIFVARQWIRHRTASVNEYSARYSILANEFYIPDAGVLGQQDLNNRQGRSGSLPAKAAAEVQRILTEDALHSYETYEGLMRGAPMDENESDLRPGIARELARMNLTLNFYTEWYWKIDLHNLMNFVKLRSDRHAQYEIRVYADVLLKILEEWVPITFKAYSTYRQGTTQLTRTGLEVVRRMAQGERPTRAEAGMSEGEWRDLMSILEITGL